MTEEEEEEEEEEEKEWKEEEREEEREDDDEKEEKEAKKEKEEEREEKEENENERKKQTVSLWVGHRERFHLLSLRIDIICNTFNQSNCTWLIMWFIQSKFVCYPPGGEIGLKLSSHHFNSS